MEWEPNTFCRSRKYNQRSCARNGNRTQSADHVHSAGTGHHLQILYIQRELGTISRSCTFNGHRTQSAHHVHSTVTGHNLQIRCTQQEPDTIRRSRYAIGTNRTMRILRTLLTTLCPSRASDPLGFPARTIWSQDWDKLCGKMQFLCDFPNAKTNGHVISPHSDNASVVEYNWNCPMLSHQNENYFKRILSQQ